MPIHELEAILNREIARCVVRIAECAIRETDLGSQPDLKLRAAIDRERDRAFISLRRAMNMLRDLPAREPFPATVLPDAIPVVPQGSRCPCGSGLKYKRCHGWTPSNRSQKRTCVKNGFEFSNRAVSAPAQSAVPKSRFPPDS